jgi:pentatricopeptide repeat protein
MPGAAERAHAILQHMNHLYDEHGIAQAKPNTHCYSSVMSAYANCGKVHQAEKVLLELLTKYQTTRDRDYLPDVTCFTSIIHAWSKSGQPNAPQMAEAVLQRMQDFAEWTGQHSLRPDVISFTTVLQAWAAAATFNQHQLGNHRHHGGEDKIPYRCEEILQRMQALYESGYANTQPNVVSFSVVLNVWAKSSHVHAAERAEAILRHMKSLYESGQNRQVKPNAFSYTCVIDAWSKSKLHYAAERAQVLYDELFQQWHETGQEDMQPNVRTVTSLISAWGRRHNKKDAEWAQAIFDDAIARYVNDADDEESNQRSQTSTNANTSAPEVNHRETQLLHASSGYNGTNVDERSNEDIIHMSTSDNARLGLITTKERSESNDKGANHVEQSMNDAYLELIAAWGGSESHDKGAHAVNQSIHDNTVLARRPPGHFHFRPTGELYTALIDAWAKAGEAERAGQILREMESGECFKLKPNQSTYTAVMDAWSRSTRSDAADRAQALFDELERKYKNGDRGWKPSLHCYTVLISAWARRRTKEGARKAQAVFDDVLAKYQSGDQNLQPRVTTYTALIDAWVKAGDAEEAERILRLMISSNLNGVKPTTASYTAVIDAWSRAGHPARALELYDEMIGKWEAGDRGLRPSIITLTAVVSAWGETKTPKGAKRAQAIFNFALDHYNKTGDEDIRPTNFTYNALIHAWGKVGDGEQAERVLREMESDTFDGIRADFRSYSAAINAWSRSHRPDAGPRSQVLYDAMIQKWEAGDNGMKPNSLTYMALISSWCRSKTAEGAKKAQEAFDDMLARYRAGDEDLKPNIVVYSALIDAWAKAGEAEEAEAALRKMTAKGYPTVKPNFILYSAVMTAWSFSGHPNATERMQALYDELMHKYREGDKDFIPNVRVYVPMLNAWSRIKTRDGIEKSLVILNDMEVHCNSGAVELREAVETYRKVITRAQGACSTGGTNIQLQTLNEGIQKR